MTGEDVVHPDGEPRVRGTLEDVFALYAEPPDPLRPVVCFDETPRQLIGEERVPIRAEPSKPARYDYEYVVRGAMKMTGKMTGEDDRLARHVAPAGTATRSAASRAGSRVR